MTAINVFLDNRACHLFADTGHYDPVSKRLDHLATKVFPLPDQHAIIAWSGISALGPYFAALCRETKARNILELKKALPSLVAKLGFMVPFSAIVVGMFKDIPTGITIEENGRTHDLGPGSVVRSIGTLVQLDPADLEASAVRLMEAQRQSSGVVFGEAQHWKVDRAGATMKVLHDWGDRPAKIITLSTLAAKIQDLTVDRINFADNSVTGIVNATTTVVAVSDGSLPNILWARCLAHYSGFGSGSSATFFMNINRTGGSVLQQRIFGFSGAVLRNVYISMFAVEVAPAANQSYTLDISASSGGGGGSGADVSYSQQEINCIYSKK